jgi:phosphoglycerate dehydrogenase-like enzyme
LAAFLSRCDILLLALPFTPDTRHILDVVTLAHLPEQALVINVGRGETIDTDALLDALNSHRLGGAALDVAEQEPLPTGHPLFGRHDVLLTPHVNGRTVAYYDRALKILLENVARYEHGEEMWNLVDYQKGY